VNLVIPEPGKSLVEAYDTWREIADSAACCDFAFHVAVTSWTDKVAQEMEILTKEKGMCCSSCNRLLVVVVVVAAAAIVVVVVVVVACHSCSSAMLDLLRQG